jgi:G6PDH family F420-dependent oxidoreductase
MLEEAVEVMRKLWTGEMVTHRGRHYRVDDARIYTLPEEPPPVYVSGFGPRAMDLAGRIGDGFVSVKPSKEAVDGFRAAGGAGKPVVAGMKACYAATEDEGRETAHRLWGNEGLPGELAQVLPSPKHFEQAMELVTPDLVKMPCGPDPKRHVEAVQAYEAAGYDTLYVAPVGPRYAEMIRLYRDEVMPAFG